MTTADLLYEIRADATELKNQFRAATKESESFGAKLKRNLKRVGVFALGAGAGIAKLTQDAIDSIDELQKLADGAGLASEDMGTLKLAAELGGTSIDSITNSVGRLSKEMKRDSKIFREIGVDVRNMAGELRPTLDVLGDVADEIERSGPGAEATALAYELFGRRGQELLPILLQGKKGIEDLREEAEALGLTFDENTARAAEAFNDNMTVLRRTLDGLFIQLASDLVPILAGYTDSLRKSVTQTKKLDGATSDLAEGLKFVLVTFEAVRAGAVVTGLSLGALGGVVFEIFEGIRKTLAEQAQGIFDTIAAISKGDFQGAADAISALPDDLVSSSRSSALAVRRLFDDATNEIAEVIASSKVRIENIFTGVFRVAKKDREDAKRDLQELSSEAETIAERLAKSVQKQAEETSKAIAGPIEDAFAAVKKASEESLGTARKELEDLGFAAEQVFDQTRTPIERYQQDVEELSRLLNLGLISQDTFARAVEDSLAQVRDAAAEAKDEVSDFDKIASRTAGLIYDSFEDFLFDPFDSSVEDMVRDFNSALGRMALQAASQQIFSALLGGGANLDNLVAGNFSGGGLVGGNGTGRSDSVPAWLSRGEYVIPADVVNRMGTAYFDAIRAGTRRGYRDGGAVGGDMNVRIVNVQSEDEILGVLGSAAGEKVIRNVIRRNG